MIGLIRYIDKHPPCGEGRSPEKISFGCLLLIINFLLIMITCVVLVADMVLYISGI